MDYNSNYKAEIKAEALELLKQAYGQEAEFRPDQYEAIESTLFDKRTLVVERTGWGKSCVYFICTRILRNRNKGVTFIISPLLSLMRNQEDLAKKFRLKCESLNYKTENRLNVINSLVNNELDLLFITPETLFNMELQANFKSIKIGLFVIDEAHCISDWGHDFRLKYGRLKNIIKQLPPNVPILGTTATANNRVVDDLEKQLPGKVKIIRGTLARESLALQVLYLPDETQRYAWLLENLPKLSKEGSGIIYCLTRRDCDSVSHFLNSNKCNTRSYHSGIDEKTNIETEKEFQNNSIDAVVATTKLGMGYDKGDIAFVIHFQMPHNIVSYYQQIGRAGREIKRAYVFLMYGENDERILKHFINTAFPTKDEITSIKTIIDNHDEITIPQLEELLNYRRSRIRKAMDFLENDGFAQRKTKLENDRSGQKRMKTYYSSSPRTNFEYYQEHYDQINKIRIAEFEQLKQLLRIDSCYLKFIAQCLDDETANECGHCSNCLKKDILPSKVSDESLKIAECFFMNYNYISIIPRKKLPTNTSITKINEIGIALSKYGQGYFGNLVRKGKIGNKFSQELVNKSTEILGNFVKKEEITCICPIPSLRSNIVFDFAKRLAENLQLDYFEFLGKRESPPQKKMENSFHQWKNSDQSFFLNEQKNYPSNVLLVDDMVDSKWTFTVCGSKLLEAGCEKIYPFALADSSHQED